VKGFFHEHFFYVNSLTRIKKKSRRLQEVWTIGLGRFARFSGIGYLDYCTVHHRSQPR